MNSDMPIHILSLGAGVQSSALALMAAAGEVTPMPVAAIFADTQAEPASVYKWLDWLETKLPFPVHRISQGNLTTMSLRLRTAVESGKTYTKHSIPAFIKGPLGEGLLMRQCTQDFKIDPIIREIAKIRKGVPGKPSVIQWIGISVDESRRMKGSRVSYVTNRWPLVDRGVTREGCMRWMKERGFPEPPRSACVYCPYHSDSEWRRLKETEPEAFERAVQYEGDMQRVIGQVTGVTGTPWLHRSCQPLGSIQFAAAASPAEEQQFFNLECEGMCGV